MKNKLYHLFAHVVNIILLGAVGFLGLALFVNISEPDPSVPSPSPIDMGIWILLLSLWRVSYWYQFKNRKWMVLLFANLLFIIAVTIVILVVMPLLYDLFYF